MDSPQSHNSRCSVEDAHVSIAAPLLRLDERLPVEHRAGCAQAILQLRRFRTPTVRKPAARSMLTTSLMGDGNEHRVRDVRAMADVARRGRMVGDPAFRATTYHRIGTQHTAST